MKYTFGILSVIIVSSFFTMKVNAQSAQTQEIGLGYGIGSTNSIASLFNELLVAGIVGAKIENQKYYGVSFVNYSYAIKDNFSVGGEFAYERITKDITLSNALEGRQTDNSLTLAAIGKYSYISNPKFRLYSGIGLGYTLVQGKYNPEKGSSSKVSKDSDGHFGFQITGLGFRFGNTIALNAELGFGYKGVFNIGINYRL